MLKKLIEQYTLGFKTTEERKRETTEKMLSQVSSLIDVPSRTACGMIIVGPETGNVGIVTVRYFEEDNQFFYQVGNGSVVKGFSGSFTASGKYKSAKKAVEALALEMARCGCI